MFDRIIVAIDDSPGAADARALAEVLAAPGAKLTTVHVTGHGHDADDVEADVTLSGGFTAAIAGFAAQETADLVVLGTHHHGHLWSANHTHQALNHMPCSVAVAPDGFAASAHPFETIGVAYDESTTEAQAALASARRIAQATGAEIQIIEVVRDSNLPSAESTQGWKAQQAGERLAALEGVIVTVLEGDPVTRLREAAADLDVLVLGQHHSSALASLLLSRTADHLTGHVRCPLLVQADRSVV